jgi:2-oxoisovalerate dehydrogenase E1 component alpha subunit
MIVANNEWGISTRASEQHGEKHIADRCRAFGIESTVIDGNDPEVAYIELRRAMDYVRAERRPFLVEATVSRLYGHSSASGANFAADEADCIAIFERKLEERRILTRAAMDEVRAKYTQELLEATKRVREEPPPGASEIWDHVFAERSKVGAPPPRGADASPPPVAARPALPSEAKRPGGPHRGRNGAA